MLLKYYFYKAFTVNLDFYLFKYYIPAGQFIRNIKKKKLHLFLNFYRPFFLISKEPVKKETLYKIPEVNCVYQDCRK